MSHIGGASIGVEGSAEDRLRARAQLRREQRLAVARKAGWQELQASDMRRYGPWLEHAPTGLLYRVAGGEIDAGYTDPVAAYYLAGGEVVPLERPSSGPTTRAEVEERRARP